MLMHVVLSALISIFLLSLTPVHKTQAASTANDQSVKEFAFPTLDGWQERSFEGNSQYELVEEDGIRVLKGYSEKQASIFYREEKIDLRKTPVINWFWKVDRTFANIDEKAKSGDDFPARLYVVAKVGLLPWDTVAINYVWSSEIPVDEVWPNPFTGKAKMVSIQSGNTYVNQWTQHSRNVAEDFKTLFNRDIEKINGYAVMVDGDNSGQEATAWFGEISFTESAPSQ